MAYYNIDEYPIALGDDVGNALCVGWQDAFVLVDRQPVLRDRCAIIGSLYVVQGINAMIRNLALNPRYTSALSVATGQRISVSTRCPCYEHVTGSMGERSE